jgi:hypothetical protein
MSMDGFVVVVKVGRQGLTGISTIVNMFTFTYT